MRTLNFTVLEDRFRMATISRCASRALAGRENRYRARLSGSHGV